MFLAIDRVSKFTHVAFFDAATQMNGAAFLREVIAAFPYAIHTVLTDNGMAFADLPKNRNGPTRRWLGAHIFDRVCREHGIEHRLTKPYHPWTNGQAERMNRTVKDATIKVFHYPDLESLKAHVLAFVTAYNFAKHLKRLHWRTPVQAICEAWAKDPAPFKINPTTSSRDHTRSLLDIRIALFFVCAARMGDRAVLGRTNRLRVLPEIARPKLVLSRTPRRAPTFKLLIR